MSVPWDRVRERYRNDAAFHAVVDMLQGMILKMELAPSEVREAAMLACVLVEERRTPTVMIPLTCQQCGRHIFPIRADEKTFSVVGACGHEIPKELLNYDV
jgi:hypothetical protein